MSFNKIEKTATEERTFLTATMPLCSDLPREIYLVGPSLNFWGTLKVSLRKTSVLLILLANSVFLLAVGFSWLLFSIFLCGGSGFYGNVLVNICFIFIVL